VRNIPGELGGANLFFVEDVAYQKPRFRRWSARFCRCSDEAAGRQAGKAQVVAPYIKNGTVLFLGRDVRKLLGQMFNLGVESHDDLCLDGDTLVFTRTSEVPIKAVCEGDRVFTRQGYKRVLWAGQTGRREVITRFG